jgi:hypothetical protein
MAVGDITQKWALDSQLTITLASLATSSTHLVGRESTAYAIDGAQPVIDVLLSGKITVGTTPTANTSIEIWIAAPINDTPTWGGGIAGTGDAAATITNAQVKNGYLKLAAVLSVVATTSNVVYPFGPISVASLFGGVLPTDIVVFVVHNTGVNLNATAGNHEISVQPVYHFATLS